MRGRIFHIFLLWLAACIGQLAVAQHPQPGDEGWYPGRFASDPIEVPVDDGARFEFVHSVDTYQWSLHKFYPETVHYSMHLTAPETTVCIYTFGSEVHDVEVRLRHIIAPGDTLECPTPPADLLVNYLDLVEGWNSPGFNTCQQTVMSRLLPPGEYMVEVSGVYTQAYGSANGVITTSIVGYPGPEIFEWSVPQHMLKGMAYNPYTISLASARETAVDIEKEITADYLGPRLNFDGRIYYSFNLADSMDVTLSTAGWPTALRLSPADSLAVAAMEVRADSVAKRRLPRGDYILAAADSAGTRAGSVIGFTLTSAPPPPPPLPPPPPYWVSYLHYDRAVAGHNYLSERTMLSADGSRYAEVTSHHDGLGRPTLQLQVGASPQGGDIASLTEYDLSGRDYRQWLAAVTPGGYLRGHEIDFSAPYDGDSAPFTEICYEPTPLGRVQSQTGPGSRWRELGRAVSHEYGLNQFNHSTLSAFCYESSDTPDAPGAAPAISCIGRYRSGDLEYHSVTDEDGHTTVEFTNPRGQLILQRSLFADGSRADTYYIYDSYGNLTAVLPPEASDRMAYIGDWDSATDATLRDYAYIYSYDRRGRVTSRQLPGCEAVTYRYDDTDRAVLTQDGNLRARGLWRFEIADLFGRPCLSGTCSDLTFTDSGKRVRARRSDDPAAAFGYNIEGADVAGMTVLTATYYDDYSALGKPFFPPTPVLDYLPAADFGERCANVRGRATATATAIPVEAGADSLTYLYSATYYDSHDRAIQTVSTNHLGGTDRTFVSYDFAGRPLLTESVHTAAGAYADSAVVQQVRRTFDDFGRELSVSHRLGREGDWMELASNSYDAVGRLVATDRGGSPQLRTDLTLDIRSRPASITSSNYYQHLDFTPGGNVSSMRWWAKGTDERERRYDFTYDDLGRLTAADYSGTGDYSTAYTYDLNGNILTLQRAGLFSLMSTRPYRTVDDLTMTYSGNRLVAVSDGVFGPYDQGAHHFVDRADEEIELTYDANGNTVSDLNRDLLLTTYDINN